MNWVAEKLKYEQDKDRRHKRRLRRLKKKYPKLCGDKRNGH